MKKFLLTFLTLGFLWATPAFAIFLVVDPDPDATDYEVEITTKGVINIVPGLNTPCTIITDCTRVLDIAGFVPGKYIFRARAGEDDGNGNIWWTDWSNPYNAGKPGNASGVRIGE